MSTCNLNATRLVKAQNALNRGDIATARKWMTMVLENHPPVPRPSTLKRVRNEERARAVRIIRTHVTSIGPKTARAIDEIGAAA